MILLRVCFPLPHIASQRPHSDHLDTSQSTTEMRRSMMIQFLFIYAVDPSDNVNVKSLQSLGSISYFYTKRDIQSYHDEAEHCFEFRPCAHLHLLCTELTVTSHGPGSGHGADGMKGKGGGQLSKGEMVTRCESGATRRAARCLTLRLRPSSFARSRRRIAKWKE